MIRRDDRLARVLERDASLVEVLAGMSPAFERLRSPALRRVLTRLVTVEQAARVARVDPDLLVSRLNRALEGAMEPGTAPAPPATAPASTAAGTQPPELASIPAERIAELDVRDDLREGREPFTRIMSARRDLPPGGALCLRAIFEPVPLYSVMEKQGLAHWTERLDHDDWRVWFFPGGGAAGTTTAPHDPRPEAGENVVVLDVRGLEPPEPMVRTLAALETLPEGGTLVQLNVRVPQFLLPRLEELGFTHEVREQDADLVRVIIRRRAD